MGEEIEYSFRTKTGTCVVTPEKLVLTRHGIAGGYSAIVFGNSIIRALVIYGLLAIVLLIFGIRYLMQEQYFGGVFLCVIGVIFILNIISSIKNSATNMINRSEVQAVKNHPPHPPITRGYFEIIFSRDGKIRKRLVMLPGSLSGGGEEYPKALAAMKESGWYNP